MSNQRKPLYQGKALKLYLEEVTFPDGSDGELEIVRHPGGAGAVALDQARQMCLIRQYRYAADDWLWEIPAGRIDHAEAPLRTAQRELQEEAGLQAGSWQSLGEMLPSPGICDERIHLYLARDLTRLATRHEAQEFIEVHWVAFEEAIAWCNAGKIVDAKTLAAIYRAQAWLQAEC